MTGHMIRFCVLHFVLIYETGQISCSHIIGIDLGTAFTSVGIYQDEGVTIIPNEHGNKATPSCVAFLATGEILIGEEAVKQTFYNPKNTIYNVKRLIGRKWDDELVQTDLKLFPFKVFERNRKPYIRVTVGDKNDVFSPEEITAMMLVKMKEMAEEYIGDEIIDAVITTPAYFNEDQRQATKHAGELAGLNIKRILSEPTAAALSYGLLDIATEKNILVYDLGGGTFDVSVVLCDNGVFTVLGTVGDPDLGGEDFNRNVINFILQKIREEFRLEQMLASDYPFIQKVREEVEFAKRKLSFEKTVLIEIENLYRNKDFRMTFTRSQFEELNKAHYATTLKLVKKALEYSKLEKGDIDDIVLVGGSSKMPKVNAMLEAYFSGKIPSESINPEDAVVRGAVIEAGVLANKESTKHIVLLDVYPFSLGFANKEKNMNTVIPRNHVIPVRKTVPATTATHSQTNVELKIFRGDYIKTEKNILLGELVLYKIPKAPKGEPIIDITFEINKDGILNVTAREATTGNSEEIIIDNVYSKLSIAELQDIKWRLQIGKYKNKQRKFYKKTKINFERMLFMIDHCVDETDTWLERNQNHNHNDFMYPMKKLFECVCIAAYGNSNEEINAEYVMKSHTKGEVIKTKYLLNYANKKMMDWFETNPKPSLELLTQHQEEIQEYIDFVLFGEYRKRIRK